MSTSNGEQPNQPKQTTGKTKQPRTKKPRAERNPSHTSQSQIIDWNEVRVEHQVTISLGKQAEQDANSKEPPEDGSLLVDGWTCCFLEVKTQVKPGARPGRVRSENKPGKFRLMRAALDAGEVIPIAIIELHGAEVTDGNLPVRFALWPAVRKRMKWEKIMIAGVQNVTDLTAERLAGLKDRIVAESEAYRRHVSPSVFRQKMLDLELETGEDIKDMIKDYCPEAVAGITQVVAATLPEKVRASTAHGLVETLPEKDRVEAVRGMGKTLPDKDRASTAHGLVETLPEKDRAEAVRGMNKTLSEKDRASTAQDLAVTLPVEEKARLMQEMLSGFTPAQREAFLAQFQKGGG